MNYCPLASLAASAFIFSLAVIVTSTRLFLARPSAVLLSAIGSSIPFPVDVRREDAIPFEI